MNANLPNPSLLSKLFALLTIGEALADPVLPDNRTENIRDFLALIRDPEVAAWREQMTETLYPKKTISRGN